MEEGVRAAIAPRLSQPVQLGHFVLVVAVAVGGGVWTLSQALADLRGEMQGIRLEIQETRIETRDLITDVRKELRLEIAQVRSDLGGQMEALRGDLSGEIASLRGELANRR